MTDVSLSPANKDNAVVWPREGEQPPAFLSRAERVAGRDSQGRDFGISHVFAQTCSILRRHLVPFSLTYGIASVVLNVPVAFTNHDSAALAVVLACTIALILYLVANVFAGTAVIYAAIEDMRGRPVDMAEASRVALRRLFPVLGATFAVVVLAILGFALFVPALMIITMLFVAVPAVLVEGLGPLQSLHRSAQLTKGYRWPIFGLWFAIFIVGLMMQSALDSLTDPVGGWILSISVQVVWDTVYGAFITVLTAVTYRDLRFAKEGVDTDQITTVFD